MREEHVFAEDPHHSRIDERRWAIAKVEYLRDGKVVNSVHLVDGDGDGVIDGKSGPKAGGTWPVGWQWFDDMYTDTVVGETVISFDEQKIVVKASKTYEFMTGEYEVRSSP
jgi:hypothetical protein